MSDYILAYQMLNNKFAVKGDFIREMEKVRIGKWAAFILGCRAG
ncbi:MAG: hypothetical protein K0Q81_252, partial [Paenibacillus sp.]|nr:hypothetical protein [Paenibacillus sp.]